MIVIHMSYMFVSKGSHPNNAEQRTMGFRGWDELGKYLRRQCELGNKITPYNIVKAPRAGRSDRDSRAKLRS